MVALKEVKKVWRLLQFIVFVFIYNTDSLLYFLWRFPCGRWLSKTNDDGSFERLLVAERVRPKVSEGKCFVRAHWVVVALHGMAVFRVKEAKLHDKCYIRNYK